MRNGVLSKGARLGDAEAADGISETGMAARREPFEIAGEAIAPGTRRTVDIPLAVMSNHTPVTLPVHVIHGRRDGPGVFISAAVHGDEIIGVEIVRRLMKAPALRRPSGTILLVPVVNALGFISHSRYLPDRRDLNRVFPGSANGSLASQLAYIFLEEVVARCQYGIDLHSAALHRTNLPQIRANMNNTKAKALAQAFGAPVILHSSLREGSLRAAGEERGAPIIVFEAGEALRFDEFAIRTGVTGCLRVLKSIGCLGVRSVRDRATPSPVSKKSSWTRAPEGGVFRAFRTIGDTVEEGEVIGLVSDPFGEEESEVNAPLDGLIVGRTNLPIVNRGDALFHIAQLSRIDAVETVIDQLEQQFDSDPLFDEDEIL
ncbi:MAG: succinylglutamate desuccinylase/aspartoacylase family protein [Parvularculaceae bacterium]